MNLHIKSFVDSINNDLNNRTKKCLPHFFVPKFNTGENMNITDLKLDDQLEHPIHGKGRISFIGDDYFGITFDDEKELLIRREELQKTFFEMTNPDENDNGPVKQTIWPYSTFVIETADAEHYPGSYWQPFVDESREILERLPEIIPKALLQMGIGELHKAPHEQPSEWPQGSQLVWPLRQQGLSMILKTQANGNNIVSLFPFFGLGTQNTLIVREVKVWVSGLEAQITANWGDSIITFFDSQFVINRAWYESGRSYDFILTGIAYNAKPAEIMEINFNRHPDQVAWMNQLLQENESVEEINCTVGLEGSMFLLPIQGWDADDYSFRAPIKSVTEFTDWLGQDGWRVRAPVMRFDNNNADLDIVITRRAWSGSESPKVGQDIEGNLWLQGYLWSVT
jgi:hypothetical protein